MAPENLNVGGMPRTPARPQVDGAAGTEQARGNLPVGAPKVDAGGTGGPVVDLPASVSGGPSLPLPAKMSGSDLMALLYTLQKKSTESNITSAQQQVKQRGKEMEAKGNEMVQKLKDLAHKSPALDIALKVFGWVALAVTVIVGAVVTAVSGGVAGPLILVGAAAMFALMVMQQSGALDKMEDAMGMDATAKMAFNLALTGVVLVMNIATAVVGGVANFASAGASAASDIAQTAEAGIELGEMGAEVATGATEVAADAVEMAETSFTEGVEIASDIAEVAGDIGEVAGEVAGEAGEVAGDVGEVAGDVGEVAGKVAKEAAGTGAKVAKATGRGLLRGSPKLLTVAHKVQSGAQMASGAVQMTTGGLTIADSVDQYDSGMKRADVMTDKARLAKLTAMNEEDMRRLKKMLEQLENTSMALMGAVSDDDKTASQIARSMSV